jgi:hypothetical protein
MRRNPRTWSAAAALGCGLLASAGAARADVEAPQACPQVFGDDDARARNAVLRELSFDLLEDGDGHIAIVHSGDWSPPTALHLRGVSVVDVDARAQQATLRVELARTCTGTYRVGQDDSIGAQARIIAVSEGALVVVHRGRLRYLAPDGAAPHVELVWASGWTMPLPPGIAGRVPPVVAPRK